MTYDFEDFKAKKEGKETPKDVLKNIEKWVSDETLTDMIIVYRTEEGHIHVSHSYGFYSTKLGMLELAKDQLLDDMKGR